MSQMYRVTLMRPRGWTKWLLIIFAACAIAHAVGRLQGFTYLGLGALYLFAALSLAPPNQFFPFIEYYWTTGSWLNELALLLLFTAIAAPLTILLGRKLNDIQEQKGFSASLLTCLAISSLPTIADLTYLLS